MPLQRALVVLGCPKPALLDGPRWKSDKPTQAHRPRHFGTVRPSIVTHSAPPAKSLGVRLSNLQTLQVYHRLLLAEEFFQLLRVEFVQVLPPLDVLGLLLHQREPVLVRL